MREAGVTHVVMEVTSHALFFEKVAPLHFRCAVFTNLTPDHLDLHGDMESYFAEKRKLFERADRAVISTATPYGERLADGLDYALYRADACTVRRVEKRGSDGVSFCVAPGDTEPFDVFLPVPGEFAVENGALAALTAHSLGVPPAVIRQAMSSFAGVRGRMERVGENPFDISVFLDYAHTPDALEKLLLSVRGFRRPEQRIVLLFGCGGDRDRSKRAQMGRIASRLADLVILTSDNCRSEDPQAILTDILEGVDKERPYRVISDRAEAIAYAVQTTRKHDILLLAGKGHEEYEIRGRQRLPFSEREIVARCMRERVEKDAN
jgi:UDP-N-acetylmuramoyl-L-alanyl-D-glutamate--2,6-diaminopimelate ligase